MYYKAITNENGSIKLLPSVPTDENGEYDKQKYQLVYVKGDSAESLTADNVITEAVWNKESPDEQKKLTETYYTRYVEYEIDPSTGLRQLYTEAEVKVADDKRGYTEYFNDSQTLSEVDYSQNIVNQSITKKGGGLAGILGNKHEINNLAVNGGSLVVATGNDSTGDGISDTGEIVLNKIGEVADNSDYGYAPSVVFNSNDVTINGAFVAQGVNSMLADLPDIAKSTATFWSNTTTVNGQMAVADAFFAGDVVLAKGSESYLYGETSFGYQNLDENNNLTKSLTVEDGAKLYAGAKNLDNAVVNINEGGNIIFAHFNKEDSEGDNAVNVVVKRDENGDIVTDESGKIQIELETNNAYAPDVEKPVVTYDEKGESTTLLSDNTYSNIVKEIQKTEAEEGWKDNVNSSSFIGGGTITIDSSNDEYYDEYYNDKFTSEDQQAYVQTDFFTIFNGDKSKFTGDTNVEFGSLVLTSSSYLDTQEYNKLEAAYETAKNAYNNGEILEEELYGDDGAFDKFFNALSKVEQQYGSTNGGTFTVSGKTLGKQDDYKNGRLVLWRDTLNGELTPDKTEGSAYQESLAMAPNLSADKIVFGGGVKVNDDGTKTETHVKGEKNQGLGAQIVFNAAFSFENEGIYAELAQKYADSETPLVGLDYVIDETKEFEKHANLVTDISSDRVLANLNANEIAFSESNYVWYDDVSRLNEGANMTINLNAQTIKIYTEDAKSRFKNDNTFVAVENGANYYNMSVAATTQNTDALAELFSKPLVDASISLNVADPSNPTATAAPTGYKVQLNAVDVADFAATYEGGMSKRDQQTAQKFDEQRHAPQNKENNKAHRFFEALYNEGNSDKVAQTIHNVGLLGYTNIQPHIHYGNPSSPFFGGNAIGSAISAEAKRGQEEQKYGPIDEPEKSEIEEEEFTPTSGVWASYTHTTVDGETYEDKFDHIAGYDLQRDGIIGGVKRQYDATLSGGLFFALTAPEIESGDFLDGSKKNRLWSKMEMTDFQFAGHLEKVINDNWELSLFVGGGMQKMDWERKVQLGDKTYKYDATGDGNTLTGTAYLAYRYDLGDQWTIRPTVGLDSEHSWLYAFKENGVTAEIPDEYLLHSLLAQAYSYDQTYYNRNLARFGFTAAYDAAQGFAGFNLRAFYSTQLGGKPAPLISYQAVSEDAILSGKYEDMQGHVMGSDAVSVGGGGFLHLNADKTLTLNGDINAIWYKHAETLNVTGGVSYRF